jgi:hypothetical protein
MLCCLALMFGGALALLRGLIASTRTLLIAASAVLAAGAPLAAWALTVPPARAGAGGFGVVCGAHLRAIERAVGLATAGPTSQRPA